MITVRRLTDRELIASTITDKKVYPSVSEDLSPPADSFVAHESEFVLYVGAYESDVFLGLFMFVQQTSVCFDAHTCLLPLAYGRSVDCAKAAAEFIFSTTSCLRITTTIPEYNKLAAKLAEKTGFKKYGHNEQCWKKAGIVYDTYLYGINKEDVCQQQYR